MTQYYSYFLELALLERYGCGPHRAIRTAVITFVERGFFNNPIVPVLPFFPFYLILWKILGCLYLYKNTKKFELLRRRTCTYYRLGNHRVYKTECFVCCPI